MKKFLPFIGVILLSSLSQLLAQCMMIPVPLEQRIEQAALIVEGRIVDQESFISDLDGHIYTANKLLIYKILKGNLTTDELILVSQGGVVDGMGETVTPSLYVSNNVEGTFFLTPSGHKGEIELSHFSPSAGPQSGIYYDKLEGDASDAFNHYPTIEGIYKSIWDQVGSRHIELNPRPMMNFSNEKSAFPKIDSISPKIITAGNGRILKIYGKNFGTNRGSGRVEFSNANNGVQWAEPLPKQYVSWGTTLIEVKVPTQAGSGIVRVIQDGANAFPGLEIEWSWLTMEVSDDEVPVLLRNNDGDGAFEWRMSNDFSNNADARKSYIRAMENWSEATCINWYKGSNTSANADVADGINIVRFGNTGELSGGVLAHTRNYSTNCNKEVAYITEIDLTYSSDRSWNYGDEFPSFHEYDLESVAVHELGHAHQMGHVIDNKNFMHATIGPGAKKRSLIQANINAGLRIMIICNAPASCGPGVMDPKSGCILPIGITDFANEENSLNIYPNPGSGIFTIELSDDPDGPIQIFNVFGEKVDEISIREGQVQTTWSTNANLKDGIYFFMAPLKGQIQARKVILER